MQLIQTVTVGSGGAAAIEFNSIPATFTDLFVKISVRSTSTGGGTVDLRMNINAQGAGVNLTNRLLYGTGSGVASVANSTVEAGFATNAADSASTFSSNEIYLPNYRSSANKSYSLDSVTENNATGAYQMILSGLWSQTAVISSLRFTMLSSNLAEYSSASLYGITAGSSGGVVVS